MEGRAKKLLNVVNDAVIENLQGVVYAHSGLRLTSSDNIIYRWDFEALRAQSRVMLLSGGGSGHEPAMAGYVGPGMLTAAVAGSIFTSPPSSSILNALRMLGKDNPGGVLIIVFNYTGDRLNFGMAAERARAEGIKVEMVVVGEDCALQSYEKSAGRRGLCGGIVSFKIAGAMSETGKCLEEICETLHNIISSMGTIGICLSVCNIPNSGRSFALENDEVELGLGVHGEAGVKRLKLLSSKETVQLMLEHMTDMESSSRLDLQKGEHVGLVVNNLGGMSQLEVNIVIKDAVECLAGSFGVIVERVLSGPMMTSLEMAGISLTVFKISNNIITYLDAPTAAPAWPKSYLSNSDGDETVVTPQASSLQFGDISSGPHLEKEEEMKFRSVLSAVCHVVIEKEAYLNYLDSESGDSDCGTTLKDGAQTILDFISSGVKLTYPKDVLLHLSALAERSMGGTSGALYGLFFASSSRAFTSDCSPTTWCQALKLGTEAVCKFGGAEPGDRTMVDALAAAYSALMNEQGHISLENAAQATEKAAQNTINMKAKAGRASYVSVTRLKSPDPGACAVAIWMRAIHQSLS